MFKKKKIIIISWVFLNVVYNVRPGNKSLPCPSCYGKTIDGGMIR